MERISFLDQIARNKRNSVILTIFVALVLVDFHHQPLLCTLAGDFDGVVDGREFPPGKVHIHHHAHNLGNSALVHCRSSVYVKWH